MIKKFGQKNGCYFKSEQYGDFYIEIDLDKKTDFYKTVNGTKITGTDGTYLDIYLRDGNLDVFGYSEISQERKPKYSFTLTFLPSNIYKNKETVQKTLIQNNYKIIDFRIPTNSDTFLSEVHCYPINFDKAIHDIKMPRFIVEKVKLNQDDDWWA